MSKLTLYEQLGYQAGQIGNPIYTCPFRIGSRYWHEWRDGWELGHDHAIAESENTCKKHEAL